MSCKFYKSILLIYSLFFALSCNDYSKSWDAIYSEQEKIFNNNRKTFEISVTFLNSSNIVDTSLPIKNSYLQLPDTLVADLKHIGISRASIRKTSCSVKSISFIPTSEQWSPDRFYILEVRFDMCDNRNRKGYHWKMDNSDHKHSFGQGSGWYIYSDSDFL